MSEPQRVPRRILSCAVTTCPQSWYQQTEDHWAAIRAAVKRGWQGDGVHGCMCADDQQFCPDHGAEADAVRRTRG